MSVWPDEQLTFTPVAPEGDAVPLIFAFPNTYSIGITSLGYQIIWATLASRPDVAVSRLFTDSAEPLPQRPELLGFSVSWELDFINILNLLEQLQVPIRSRDRDSSHPLVFGGGPVLTANPEPFAEFFDVVLLGDGEELLPEFIETYRQVRGRDREGQLKRLAQVEGIYIPALYRPCYGGPTEPQVGVEPLDADVPTVVKKRTFRGTTLSASTVVTPQAAWENIYMVEVVRSCPEMCRFCLASYLTLPFRVANLEESLIPAIERGLQYTQRLGLLGASITQHPRFGEVIEYLGQDCFADVQLSLASVRTGTVTEDLTRLLTARGSHSLTIAIESGSPRLREIINKKLENWEIEAAVAAAAAGGLSHLKFYGMVGIPGEQSHDLDLTIELLEQLRKQVKGLRLAFGCSTFVPKAQTPFQWSGVDTQAEKKLKRLQKELRNLQFRPESYNWSVIQALISRGDRRVAEILLLVRDFGESLGSYKRAFKELKGQLPPLAYYVHETWPEDTWLPWQHIQGPLSITRLQEHREQALALV